MSSAYTGIEFSHVYFIRPDVAWLRPVPTPLRELELMVR